MTAQVTVNGTVTGAASPLVIVVRQELRVNLPAVTRLEDIVREVTGREPGTWTDGTGTMTITASEILAAPVRCESCGNRLVAGECDGNLCGPCTDIAADALDAELSPPPEPARQPGPQIERAGYGTEAAAARLCELTGVELRTAMAMLTIAASEIGEYVINGIRVRGDDDAQEFIIEPF